MTYWLAALALVVLGYLTGFSIGWFLLPIGLAMLVLGPFRHRSLIYWPPMAGVLAFLVGYLSVAPLICAANGVVGGGSTIQCSSLIGIGYSGSSTYNPSLLPAIVAGLALALFVGLLVLGLLWRVSRPPAGDGA